MIVNIKIKVDLINQHDDHIKNLQNMKKIFVYERFFSIFFFYFFEYHINKIELKKTRIQRTPKTQRIQIQELRRDEMRMINKMYKRLKVDILC